MIYLKTVNEMAKITGISRRTIRYYDQIGLFKPTRISESGYRLYDDKALEILQQILLFKELNIPLKDIKLVLNNPNLDKTTLLKSHKKLLILKRNHLTELISLIDKIIKEPKLMIFSEFNIQRIEQRLESNFEVLKNSSSKDYEAIASLYGGDTKELVKKAIECIRENPELITNVYGSLEGYYDSLGGIEQRLENSETNKNKVMDIYEKLSDMKDKDVSCPEVQNLIAEVEALDIEMGGLSFKKSDELRKINWKKLENDPENLKKYNDALKSAEKGYDNMFGSGSYEFYRKAVEYYLANK